MYVWEVLEGIHMDRLMDGMGWDGMTMYYLEKGFR